MNFSLSLRAKRGNPGCWGHGYCTRPRHPGSPRSLRSLAMTGIILCVVTVIHASDTQLKEGNRLFRSGKYDEALKKYNDALIDAPHSSMLRFNIGDAAYQSGDFGTAEKRFQEVADETPMPVLKGAAHYNRGNALFRQQKWKDSVEAYKESLRANPQDEDAKYNLGVALNVLKNPPPPSKQPKSGKDDPKKDKDSGKKESAGARPGDMSKQDAERLLAAAGSGERKKPNAKGEKSGAAHPDEDW